MEIILKEDMPKLGRKGDVVKVADGYGRNYLLPHHKAIAASAGNLKNIEQMRSAGTRKEARDREAAQAIAGRLSAVRLVFERRAGEHDVLFGSVTSMDIAQALEERGFPLERRKVELPEALKSLGEFKVAVRLFKGVDAEVTVEIKRLAVDDSSAAGH